MHDVGMAFDFAGNVRKTSFSSPFRQARRHSFRALNTIGTSDFTVAGFGFRRANLAPQICAARSSNLSRKTLGAYTRVMHQARFLVLFFLPVVRRSLLGATDGLSTKRCRMDRGWRPAPKPTTLGGTEDTTRRSVCAGKSVEVR
jgi:hypothetical protein